MIPKTLHYIWLGDNPLNGKLLEHLQASIALNPDFTHHTWVSNNAIRADLEASCVGCPTSIKNIDSLQDILRNFDCIKECLAAGSTLMAVDTLKIDLMVHLGGVYVDIGIRPTQALSAVIKPTDRALCDIHLPTEFIPRTHGFYHFHASEKNGKVYTIAQDIQRKVYLTIKRDESYQRAILNKDPIVKYLITKMTTGKALFNAVDCVYKLFDPSEGLIRPLRASSFGAPKLGMARSPRTPTGLTLIREVKKSLTPIYADAIEKQLQRTAKIPAKSARRTVTKSYRSMLLLSGGTSAKGRSAKAIKPHDERTALAPLNFSGS